MSLKSVLGSGLLHVAVILSIGFISGWISGDKFYISMWPPGIHEKTDSQTLIDSIAVIKKELVMLRTEKEISIGVRESLANSLNISSETIDSLERVIRWITRQDQAKQEQLDEMFARDSATTIKQYRLALENLGVIPNMSERLTFREIGLGAKLLNGFTSLKLEYNVLGKKYTQLEKSFSIQDLDLAECNSLNGINDEIITAIQRESNSYRLAYESANSFWKDRIIFGIGYGGQFNFNDNQVTHGVQAGVFIKLGSL